LLLQTVPELLFRKIFRRGLADLLQFVVDELAGFIDLENVLMSEYVFFSLSTCVFQRLGSSSIMKKENV